MRSSLPLLLLVIVLFAFPPFADAGSQVYSTPGTYTFTVPAYGTLTVEVWGGGGGGGNGSDRGGSGGGGGGYAAKTYAKGTLSPGVSASVVVGNGGASRSSGGTSSFNSQVSATGGAGGKGGDCEGDCPGGAGGTGSGGTMNTSGQNGQNASYRYDVGGAGGAGANGGAGGRGAAEGSSGTAGTAPGGGGGGGHEESTVRGSSGAPGKVVITWTDAPPPSDTLSCSITFDKNPIDTGGSTTIRWSSNKAKLFYIKNIGYVGASGSATVAPGQTTDFSGTVSDSESAGVAGSKTYDTPGTYTFTVPEQYGTLTVEVWGGGGGGGGAGWPSGGSGSSGASSSFNGRVIAGGGIGSGPGGGAGGNANGGDTNTSGSAGSGGGVLNGGTGGTSPNGGGGGSGSGGGAGGLGGPPGGGGGGGCSRDFRCGGGGGGGAYAKKTYAPGDLTGSVSVTVGGGGAGGASTVNNPRSIQGPGGSGASGMVKITWEGGVGGTTATCPATLTVNDTSCPPGYVMQNGTCVKACPISYSCSGNTIVRTNADCSTTETVCALPMTCVPGYNVCRYPSLEFEPFTAQLENGGTQRMNGHLRVVPTIVQQESTARVYWNVKNAAFCTVSGNNVENDTWNLFFSGVVGQKTSPIHTKTWYTLHCTDRNGESLSESRSVDVVPNFTER